MAQNFYVGNDLVSIHEFGFLMTKNFLDRCYTAAEVAYCQHKADPLSSFAARWAAKEAVLKVLGQCLGKKGEKGEKISPFLFRLREIEIVRSSDREPPRCQLHGRLKTLLQKRLERVHWSLSLSHDEGYAMATVLLAGSPRKQKRKKNRRST